MVIRWSEPMRTLNWLQWLNSVETNSIRLDCHNSNNLFCECGLRIERFRVSWTGWFKLSTIYEWEIVLPKHLLQAHRATCVAFLHSRQNICKLSFECYLHSIYSVYTEEHAWFLRTKPHPLSSTIIPSRNCY